MGTTTLMSLAEFERLDGPEHLELLHGELIRMPPAERRHNNVARTLFLLVHAAIERRRADSSERVGRAEVEMGYLLSTDPPSWLQPDVSISGAGQPGEKYFEGAPLVAVEVVSQSDAAAHLEAKVLSHLARFR